MIDKTTLPNAFEFIVTAGARARQLMAGAEPRVPAESHKKTIIAQREVASKAVERVDEEKGELGD